jgi:hypothetical protein
MSFTKTLMAAAAIATVSAQPVLAAEAAQKLSLKNSPAASARASTKAGKSRVIAGVPLVLAIIGGGLIIYGITEVIDDDDSDSN